MPDITSNLVGHWKLDETSGTATADETANNNDGTLSGGAAFTSSGQIDGAVDFGSGGDVEIADAAELNFDTADDFTFSAWVYVPSAPGSWSGLVAKGRAGPGTWYGFWISDSNEWHFGGGYSAGFNGGSVTSGWHHLVGVQVGGVGRTLYHNGSSIATGSAADADSTGYNLFFGNADGSNEQFYGRIDEVRIYARALDSSDVAALYAYTGSSVIDGVAAFTEPNEALTGAAAVAVAGVGTFTEPVGTLTGVAAVANTGSAAFTEPGETLSSAVEVRWYAAAAFTEPGDALTSAVAVAVVGAVNASDPVPGTLSSDVDVAVISDGAFTEPGESLSSEGTVTGGAITTDAAFTEANEALTGAGLVVVAGALANAEANEALTGVGAVTIVGSAEFTEANESLASEANGSMFVDVAFTEPNESHTGAGEVDVAGSMQATEANESHTGAGTVGVVGAGAFTEANETHTGAGLVVIIGTASFTEPNEQLGSLVDTGVGFAFGTHRRISVGVGIGI